MAQLTTGLPKPAGRDFREVPQAVPGRNSKEEKEEEQHRQAKPQEEQLAGAAQGSADAAGAAADAGAGESSAAVGVEQPATKRPRLDLPSTSSPHAHAPTLFTAFPSGDSAPVVDPTLVGAALTGTVEAATESTYYISLTLAGVEFKGALFCPPATFFAAPAGPGAAPGPPPGPPLKRPRTAFNFYSDAERPKAKEQNPLADQKDISRMVGDRWAQMSAEEREPFHEAARQDKERYDREMRDYQARFPHGSRRELQRQQQQQRLPSAQQQQQQQQRLPSAQQQQQQRLPSAQQQQQQQQQQRLPSAQQEQLQAEQQVGPAHAQHAQQASSHAAQPAQPGSPPSLSGKPPAGLQALSPPPPGPMASSLGTWPSAGGLGTASLAALHNLDGQGQGGRGAVAANQLQPSHNNSGSVHLQWPSQQRQQQQQHGPPSAGAATGTRSSSDAALATLQALLARDKRHHAALPPAHAAQPPQQQHLPPPQPQQAHAEGSTPPAAGDNEALHWLISALMGQAQAQRPPASGGPPSVPPDSLSILRNLMNFSSDRQQ